MHARTPRGEGAESKLRFEMEGRSTSLFFILYCVTGSEEGIRKTAQGVSDLQRMATSKTFGDPILGPICKPDPRSASYQTRPTSEQKKDTDQDHHE